MEENRVNENNPLKAALLGLALAALLAVLSMWGIPFVSRQWQERSFRRFGDCGSLKVGSYEGALFGDERYYDATLDWAIDEEDCAPVYRLPSDVLYIPDHNYQGFDECRFNERLFWCDLNGRVTIYRKIAERYCDDDDWICTDGTDYWEENPDGADLVTQTCMDDEGIVCFVSWQRVGEKQGIALPKLSKWLTSLRYQQYLLNEANQ